MAADNHQRIGLTPHLARCCECPSCTRNRAFDSALEIGDKQELRRIYDSLFESWAEEQIDTMDMRRQRDEARELLAEAEPFVGWCATVTDIKDKIRRLLEREG